MLFCVRNYIVYPLDLNTPNLINPVEKDHRIINIVGISLDALNNALSPSFNIEEGLLNPSYIDSFQD
jgi:hypothetical protein